MKTEIWYSLENEGPVNIYIEFDKSFDTVVDQTAVKSNNIRIIATKSDCAELSKYFLKLSRNLNKLKELNNGNDE